MAIQIEELLKLPAKEREYIVKMGVSLPEGIRLAFDGRFAKMISLKTKNYVLLTYDGRKIFKGASLRSRSDERFGRKFLEAAVDSLLNYDQEAVAKLYSDLIEALLNRKVPIAELARRERITAKTSGSSQKRRAAAISGGIPLGDHMLVYEKSDGSLGLLENYAHDENPRYYMDKLYKFARRLEEAFDGNFDKLIPKPTAQGLPHKFQTSLDFF